MINSKLGVILGIFVCFILNDNCVAQQPNECIITPEMWNVGVLPEAENSNNLTKSYTSFESARGKKIMITGKVLDGNCVPISEAKVSIWQANAIGVFQFNDTDNQYFDKHFRSSGSMITDNVGSFQFITIYPGKVSNLAPNVIFRIEHSNLMPIETKMFFPEYENYPTIRSVNAYITRKQVPLLVAKRIEKDDEMPVYLFVITLKQTNSYKEY